MNDECRTKTSPRALDSTRMAAHKMLNVNVFVDVDLTLVDERGGILPGAADSLRRLKQRGCHLFLWSTGGGEYARVVAERYQLAELFEGFLPKPDIIIDDMPGVCL